MYFHNKSINIMMYVAISSLNFLKFSPFNAYVHIWTINMKCAFENGWLKLSYVIGGVMKVLNFVCGHGVGITAR